MPKTKVIIGVVPKKGALYGYKVSMNPTRRRKILMKVANMESKLKKSSLNKKRQGIVAVIRRLNLLAVYNKRNPNVVSVMRSDIKYLQKQKDKNPLKRKSGKRKLRKRI